MSDEGYMTLFNTLTGLFTICYGKFDDHATWELQGVAFATMLEADSWIQSKYDEMDSTTTGGSDE